MKTVLLSAPYMIPLVERFKPVFEQHAIKLIVPQVRNHSCSNSPANLMARSAAMISIRHEFLRRARRGSK